MEEPTNIEIYQWLETQNFQTDYSEYGEHKMYYDLDMPKIFRAYEEWRNKYRESKLSSPQ
jgi:hypothetical protein